MFSSDRIIDELWGEDAGPDKQSSLWVCVSGLRKALEPGLEKRTDGTVLLTRSPATSSSSHATPSTPGASRPAGLVGVYAITPAALVALAESAVDRRLSDDECATIMGPCPTPTNIPDDLPLRAGLDADGAVPPDPMALAGTRVTIAAPALRAEAGLERQYEAFTEQTGIEIDVVSNTGEGLGDRAGPRLHPDEPAIRRRRLPRSGRRPCCRGDVSAVPGDP